MKECPKCVQKPCDSRSSGSENNSKKVADLHSQLNKLILPIVEILPRKQKNLIRERQRSGEFAHQSISDIVAQSVFLDAHLRRVESANTCGIELACIGQSFDDACILRNLGRDETAEYQTLLAAIKAQSSTSSSKGAFQQKCNVQNFIRTLTDRAKKINPVVRDGVNDCSPSVELADPRYDEDVREFLKELFDGQDSSSCHY